MSKEQHDRAVREVMTVRGLAAAIQAMAAPTFRNLADLLRKLGWNLTRTNKQTKNEQDESNWHG